MRHWAQHWLGLLLWLGVSGAVLAQENVKLPFPTLETGMHTAIINRLALDQAGRYAVTASDDKTARVWDLHAGQLLQTLRVPLGPEDEGKLYAVASSPDGSRVALGGFTGAPGKLNHSVYFFDRANGQLLGRIAGLPNVVNHLAWSPDGRRLALALGGRAGIRVHGTTAPYAELARDTAYGGASYSVDFDRAGRLVSTCYDGKIRLYGADWSGGGPLLPAQVVAGGARPYGARFSPDSRRIAVGFADSSAVTLLGAADLQFLTALDTRQALGGSLSSLAWSADGQRIFAAGRNQLAGATPVRVFDGQSGQALAVWLVATDVVMDLQTLADGRLVFAAGEPSWGVVDGRGQVSWRHSPTVPDHRGNFDGWRLSASGERLAFEHKVRRDGVWQRQILGFDGARLTLLRGQEAISPDLTLAQTTTLPVADWQNTPRPSLAGQRLKWDEFERSRSLAIAADRQHFALGADWSVRWFDAQGKTMWRSTVVAPAWLVNTSADGRWVVAALGDGTLRWYRTTDGSEALALLVHADGQRWVAWTPEGFFAASADAEGLMGYVLNQGPDQAPEFVAAAQLHESFYRPDLLAKRLAGDEAALQTALAALGDVRQLLASGLAPTLELLGPRQASVAGQYELKFRITPRSGGVGRLLLKVNGVAQNLGHDPAPLAGEHSLGLNFTPGRYILELTVYAAGNRLPSPSQAVDLTVAVASAPPRRQGPGEGRQPRTVSSAPPGR